VNRAEASGQNQPPNIKRKTLGRAKVVFLFDVDNTLLDNEETQ